MKRAGFVLLTLICNLCYGQGYNHNYLIGYTVAYPPWGILYDKGIIKIDAQNFNISGSSRKMKFGGAQANIANDTGAILFYTNGCWIANALEDTMLNGTGLNPDPYVLQVCTPPSALPYPQANIILPYPGDSNKYVLFHHGGSQADPTFQPLISYYSVIDMTLDGGLGGVVSGQKNVVLIADTLNIGFTACRHANGRDWWVVILRGNSNLIYTILLNDQGVQTPFTQSLGVPNVDRGTYQPTFSPDGKKFAYRYATNGIGNAPNQVRVFDFDRCSGIFSNPQIVAWASNYPSHGLAFSSNSKYLYTVSDFDTIYQINTDTSNIQASMQVVAVNDGYYSPFPPFQSSFWSMYLAANGKIIVSSGNGVVDLHYINFPDSAGLACDVKQHALPMPCWTGASHVNHPNYYLGCDTTQTTCPCLITGVNNLSPPDFKYRIYPNPVTNGVLSIGYLLPQNKSGVFEIYDVTGKVVFKYNLPPWSNEQSFKLPELSNGVYNCVIRSDDKRVSKKIAVIR